MSNPPFPLSAIGALFALFFQVMVNLLAFIIYLLNLAHIPGTLGLAIIIITVFIRLLVWPLMSSQIKVSRRMADLKPHLDELKVKHGKDKQALAAAQSALYKEHGINPAGGCLPALIQIPILYSLYSSIFTLISTSGGLAKFNSLLINPTWHLKTIPDTYFLGLNLANKPSDFGKVGFFLLLVPVITALLQYVQSTMMMSSSKVKPYPSDSPKEKKEKESAEDTMTAVQGQMKFMMPLMIGVFAYQFPIGLAIYWNTFTLMGILQQYKISGWGDVGRWKGKLTGGKELKISKNTKVKIERN